MEALGNCPVCSLLNPALCKRRKQRIRKTTQTYTTYTIYYTTLLETVQYKKRKSISQFVRVLSRKSSVTVWRIWRHTRGRKQLIIFFASDPLYDVNVINTTFIHIYDVTWVSVFFRFRENIPCTELNRLSVVSKYHVRWQTHSSTLVAKSVESIYWDAAIASLTPVEAIGFSKCLCGTWFGSFGLEQFPIYTSDILELMS